MPTPSDAGFMDLALELAREGWGRVHPNPMVGAVVVRDDTVVGRGAHREFGGPHAEIEALSDAGEAARGATLYVTLEPCAHHGKTPPCTDAILAAGVKRVVYAVADPHKEAAGGAERLREAGVETEAGVGAEQARAENALFLAPFALGRPFVALKLALSLDGRIAARSGERTTITGEAAREEVHRLRAGFDAILVGSTTARVDDPLLNVRHGPAPRVQPARVVVDSKASLSPATRLARTTAKAPVRVLHGPDADPGRLEALSAVGVETLVCPSGDDGIDLESALTALMERGVRTVLCEGGGRIAASLLSADLVDRMYLFQAPLMLGPAGVPAFPFEGAVPSAAWSMAEAKRIGGDVLLVVERER